jgi:hypothetical protein
VKVDSPRVYNLVYVSIADLRWAYI